MIKLMAAFLLALPIALSFNPPALAQEPGDEIERAIEEQMRREEIKTPEQRKKELPPIKMVFIEGGCYEMGDWTGEGDDDERPVHEVCVGDFYLMETEVTNELWQAVMGFPTLEGADPKSPAIFVSWSWARRFINELNEITEGFYRLPTEAEWEYAAREKGKKTKYPGTSSLDEVSDYAWFNENADGAVQLVAQKRPNALGLYDMAGNVWEWTEDNFDFDFYQVSPSKDPVGPEASIWRTLRGGSIADDPHKLRTTYRYGFVPTHRSPLNGLRLAE